MDRAPKASPFLFPKAQRTISVIFYSCNNWSVTTPFAFDEPFSQDPQSGLSQPIKAKSCKELQFQGEKIAAGDIYHSRLSVPTADRLVSGDPFQYPTFPTPQLLLICFFAFSFGHRGNAGKTRHRKGIRDFFGSDGRDKMVPRDFQEGVQCRHERTV